MRNLIKSMFHIHKWKDKYIDLVGPQVEFKECSKCGKVKEHKLLN